MFERLSSSRRREIAEAAAAGARKGWHGFLWMMKILAPISLATALLQWSGWLAAADFLLGPLMGVLSLPPVAAVPLIVGMLTNLYGAIAAMVVLPLNQGQMTLVAIFLLIAHNLVQEGVIQGQSGLHPFKATVFRLVVATLTVTAVAPFLDHPPPEREDLLHHRGPHDGPRSLQGPRLDSARGPLLHPRSEAAGAEPPGGNPVEHGGGVRLGLRGCRHRRGGSQRCHDQGGA